MFLLAPPGWAKNAATCMTIILSNLNRFTIFFTGRLLLKLINIWQSYRQECDCFVHFSPILIFFTDRLSNKPFLIWLLTTPPHLQYVATIPCNLSLMACLADINVLQGSVGARCNGMF